MSQGARAWLRYGGCMLLVAALTAGIIACFPGGRQALTESPQRVPAVAVADSRHGSECVPDSDMSPRKLKVLTPSRWTLDGSEHTGTITACGGAMHHAGDSFSALLFADGSSSRGPRWQIYLLIALSGFVLGGLLALFGPGLLLRRRRPRYGYR